MKKKITLFGKSAAVKLIGLPKEWHGEGPFKVIKTERVDKGKCDCGADYYIKRRSLRENLKDYDELCMHNESCGVIRAMSVAHPQLVTIQTPEGEFRISGYWLVPA